MWNSENEGAKFWLGVLTELSQRGVDLIACVDGLKGFSDAINTALPANTCSIVYIAYGSQLIEVCFMERL